MLLCSVDWKNVDHGSFPLTWLFYPRDLPRMHSKPFHAPIHALMLACTHAPPNRHTTQASTDIAPEFARTHWLTRHQRTTTVADFRSIRAALPREPTSFPAAGVCHDAPDPSGCALFDVWPWQVLPWRFPAWFIFLPEHQLSRPVLPQVGDGHEAL